MNRLKAQGRIKVQNEPWWWARVTLPCCRESHRLEHRANRSLALPVQSVGRERNGRRGTAAPSTLRCNWASFQGKTRLLSPPRPGREFRDENANESGSSAIFVANDRSGSSYTKPAGSNYMVNMKCLSRWDCDVCKRLFVNHGQDLIKPKLALLCN